MARRSSSRGAEAGWGGCRAAAVSPKLAPRPKLAEEGARGWRMGVLICVLLGLRRRWRRPRAAREETNGEVRFRSSRGKEPCRERAERERCGVDRNLHRLPLLRRCPSSSTALGMDGARQWGVLSGEERG
jgi:hypothetical protein